MSEQRPAEGRGGDMEALAAEQAERVYNHGGYHNPSQIPDVMRAYVLGAKWAAALAAQPAAPQPTEGGALTEVDRLHSGLHQCRGGRFYDDDDPEYRGTSATRGPCPTAAAARAGLAARSQPPEGVTEELAFYRKGWAKARAVLAHVADRLDEFTYDEFATVLDDGPADDAADYPAQRPEGEVCACGYGTVCQACKLADRLAAQRTEGVTLMTEPHDGHAANETCPGCPHAAEVSDHTEAGGDRG